MGEALSDVVESAGTFGRNVVDTAGLAAGRIPGVGTGLGWVLHWIATVVSAAADLVATVVKVVVELAVALAVALLRLLAGLIGGAARLGSGRAGRRTFVQGLGEVAASLGGPLIVVAGKGLALVQAALLGQRGERPLTADEHARLDQVFRGSVALYNVRVVDGFSGLFGLNGRPFTLGNTIYMKRYLQRRGPERYAATLVHECGHVWQNQNVGTRYAIQALWAQCTIADRYDWTKELARGNTRWSDFNREAQAQLLMHVWQGADGGPGAFYADDPVGEGVRFAWDGIDRTALAKDAIRRRSRCSVTSVLTALPTPLIAVCHPDELCSLPASTGAHCTVAPPCDLAIAHWLQVRCVCPRTRRVAAICWTRWGLG